MDDGLFSGGERELTHQIKTAFNGLDLFIYQRDAEGAISLSNFKGTSKLLPFLWGELNLLDFHHCKDLGFSLETYNGKDHRRIIISISSRAHSVTTLQRQMSITWVKVRCFLDMMGSQELYSSLLLTYGRLGRRRSSRYCLSSSLHQILRRGGERSSNISRHLLKILLELRCFPLDPCLLRPTFRMGMLI